MRFLPRALGFDDGGDFGIDFGESVVGLKHSRLPLRIERKNRLTAHRRRARRKRRL